MKRSLVLALTVILGLAALFAIDGYYRDQIQQENLQNLTTVIEDTVQELEEGINQRTLAVEDLRAFMLASPTIPDSATFDRYAALVLSHYPEVRALQYVDTNHIIRYTYPLTGNEAALNLDLMTRPAAPFVEKAIQTRSTTINHPTVTVQGSLSIVARSPIYDGDRYIGLAQGVFDITSLLQDVSRVTGPRFGLRLRDATGDVFWDDRSITGNALTRAIKVGDNHWELTLGWARSEPAPEPYVLALIWGLGGALLLSVIFIVNQTFRRVDWLSAAINQKTADLAKSEARYRTLVETADDVILLTDLEGRYLFRNSAYYTSLGFEEGRDVELDELTRVHPDDKALLQQKRQQVLETVAASAEYRVRHKNGDWLYHYARFKLIRDQQGKPQSILAVISDITERKQAEEALRESEASLRESQRVAHVGHWVWDTQKNQVVWSDEMKRIFGLDPTQFVGDLDKIIEQAIHPEDREKVIEANNAVLAQLKPAPIEYRIVRPDQSVRTIWAVPGDMVSDENERVLKLTGIVQDITERKQAEEALREISENMAAAQRIAHFGSWEIKLTNDLDFIDPQLWSDECYRIFGVEPGSVEITKDFFYDHVHPDDREMASQALLNVIQERGAAKYEYRLVRPNGSIRHIRDRVNVIRDERTGQPVKVVGIVQDITERKQLEAENKKLADQFYQAQKMDAIGKLAGGIAHDFNNLLVPIIGYAELGQMNSNADDPLYPNFTRIKEAAERAASLTRQILAFSRRQVLEMTILDLNQVISEFEKMLRRLIGEDILLQTHLAAGLPTIKADQSQIEQVLMNLVINARDAMPDGGVLTIETNTVMLDKQYAKSHPDVEPGLHVMLAVSDTGHGMDAETRQRLFEPFFTTKTRGRGTGLGLATVFGIVKQHQGNIWVYSEPGQGTTFKIYLPVTETGLKPGRQRDALTINQLAGTETILVVEDEPAVRQLVVFTLQENGYRVLEASSPGQALELAAAHPETIDLLLTDVVMPELNGRQLYARLVKLHPDIRVLYMSGYTDNVISHHGVLDGNVAFLAKPFSMHGLLKKVRNVLTQATTN